MSYALMLFEELFASQLSVPSSPVHPIKCTTVQMNKKKTKRKKKRKKYGERYRKGATKKGNTTVTTTRTTITITTMTTMTTTTTTTNSRQIHGE